MAIDDYTTRSDNTPTGTFEWGQIEWLDGSGVTEGDGLTVARVTIHAGQGNTPHRHPNCAEALYLMAGKLDHTLGDGKTSLEPGDLIHVPRNEPHGATNTGNEDAVMLVAYDTAERDVEFVE